MSGAELDGLGGQNNNVNVRAAGASAAIAPRLPLITSISPVASPLCSTSHAIGVVIVPEALTALRQRLDNKTTALARSLQERAEMYSRDGAMFNRILHFAMAGGAVTMIAWLAVNQNSVALGMVGKLAEIGLCGLAVVSGIVCAGCLTVSAGAHINIHEVKAEIASHRRDAFERNSFIEEAFRKIIELKSSFFDALRAASSHEPRQVRSSLSNALDSAADKVQRLPMHIHFNYLKALEQMCREIRYSEYDSRFDVEAFILNVEKLELRLIECLVLWGERELESIVAQSWKSGS